MKDIPADADDARPARSRHPSSQKFKANPADRRESLKDNPADADDARPARSRNLSTHSLELLLLLRVTSRRIGERVGKTFQLMLMMLALRSGEIRTINHSLEPLRLLCFTSRGLAERA